MYSSVTSGWLAAATFALAFLLVSCSREQEPPTNDSLRIQLNEGTNIAAAMDTHSGNLILALQGGLYLKQPGESEAARITSWDEDAWEPDISPDGASVIYKGYVSGNWDLWQKSLNDPEGRAQQITSGMFDDREPQYSPDGSSVLFSSDRRGSYDIWHVKLGAGMPEQLTHTKGETHAPAWSPDGSQFAYITDGRPLSGIYIQSLSAPKPMRVYESNSKLSALSWSPDGNVIAFRSLDRAQNGNAMTSMRLLNLQSGADTIVTPADADVFPFRAQWIDEQSFVYTSDGVVKKWQRSAESPTTIPFSVELSLTKPKYPRKTRDFDTVEPQAVLGISYPVISPDGDRIAYTAIGDLWVWQISTQKLSQLTDDAAADQMPSWSPDGNSLSYVSDKNGRFQVWVYDLLSKDAQPIEIDRKVVSFPAFSPDGSKIAFYTDVPGQPLLHVSGQLSIYDLTSGEIEYFHTPMPPEPLAWSADGKYVITSNLSRYNQRFREGLYDLSITDIATGKEHQIRPEPHQSIKHTSYSSGASAVTYSQNGVLYTQKLTPDMQADGGPIMLYDQLADTPAWSANGRYISFQAGDKIKRIDTDTREVIDITPPMRWTAEQPKERWVLRAGKLYDGVSEGYQHNVDIVIEGNRIASVSPVDKSTNLPVVDALDKAVIPGMFESHSHIGDHNHDEEQGRVWLAYGITSVRDPGSNPYLANERKEAWNSGRRIGPRLFTSGHNIDGNRIFYAVSESIASDAHLERALERSRLLNVDLIKTYVRLPNAQQKRVVEFAHDMGVPTTSHELLPAAAIGVDGIEHFTGTSRRGYTTKISELGRSYQDVEEVLAASGMSVVPTMVVPGVVLTFGEQSDLYSTDSFNAFYGPEAKHNYQDFMSFFGPGAEGYVDNYGELLSKLIARGALVGTGTDSPFTPFGTGLHAELRLYQREGLEPWQILHAATYQSARLTQVEHELGSIEAGKLADMVIVDGDPLKDVKELNNIEMTIKNGRRYTVEQLRHSSIYP